MEVGLSPQAIATKDFKLCRRGFSPEDVSGFLLNVAAAYQQALDWGAANQARAEQAEAGSTPRSFDELGAEAGALMQAAKEAADTLRRRAEEDAAILMARASEQTEKAMREVGLESDRLRNATKRRCDEMLAEAQARADRLADGELKLRAKLHELEGLFASLRDAMDAPTYEGTDVSSVDERSHQGSAELPVRPASTVAT
jgi:cell division septum initiation protein DivIVA